MYVIGFNGPPESGKDTLAQMVYERLLRDRISPEDVILQLNLGYPLRRQAYELVGYEGKQLDGPDYESFKRTTFGAPFYVTGRQIMIDVSEKFLKPTYGQTCMIQLFTRRYEHLKSTNSVLLIRDCGFQTEVDPLIDWVGVTNFHIAQVHRPGKTFEGDSREWVFPPLGRRFNRVDNNAGLDKLRAEAEGLVFVARGFLGWTI